MQYLVFSFSSFEKMIGMSQGNSLEGELFLKFNYAVGICVGKMWNTFSIQLKI